ncbi:MAG TPA: DEAD/DEAH box helicase [Anaeromyxobacteraceae bacterium]|jgi:ATP-dependent RNA helicase DeaD|nr:DEAD/DEAH box helicase [Anaeromyxobacteraceae bacterium]
MQESSPTFDALELHPALRQALAARGYDAPTPVQAAVLASDHAGRDLLVSAQTGSGKTVAFGLVVAPDLLGEGALPPAGKPLVLVIEPTRELAMQVQAELSWLYAPLGARVTACVGGMDPRREQRALAGGAHVVVGTPGRLCDHLDRKNLSLASLRALVLDEADEMLDMGFRDELELILAAAPGKRRTIFFSATLPKPIVELARKYQQEALRIAATPAGEAHQDIEYRAHFVSSREREHAVVNVLRLHDARSALVFCNTREAVNHLSASLGERGFATVAISGELTQAERTRALKQLRDGRARVLVATDVAARGLDLPDVSLVIHADLPRDAPGLQHRSGRTGRAGRKGVSVLLVPPARRALGERMLRTARVEVPWTPVPDADAVRARDQERLLEAVEALAAEPAEDDLAVAERLLATKTPLALAAALVRSERQKLPAPEELPETASLRLREPARMRAEQPDRPRPAGKSVNVTPGDSTWFKLTLGRREGADPRFIVPLLCHRGGITNREIGRIVIMAEETRFEIARAAAERFAEAAGEPDPRHPRQHVLPSQPPPGYGPGAHAGPAGKAGPRSGPAKPAGKPYAKPFAKGKPGTHPVSGEGHRTTHGVPRYGKRS